MLPCMRVMTLMKFKKASKAEPSEAEKSSAAARPAACHSNFVLMFHRIASSDDGNFAL